MIPPNVSYEWVASHQDDKKAWHELSLEEKLNTECDMLAKEAIEQSLHQPTRKQKEQLLPLEPASLNVDGVKQTSNPASAVRGAMERKDAGGILQS